MASFRLSAIPVSLQWRNPPFGWSVGSDHGLAISAGENTDCFVDPAGSPPRDNAPCALFVPPHTSFVLSARVKVEFVSAFDAGALQIRAREDLWAKLCFEYSPQRQPMIVSVVTRGASDDANSAAIDGREVYLRAAVTPQTLAFHYSRDGSYWELVRHFTLGGPEHLEIGFSSQSPTGQGCTAVFSRIVYREGVLKDNRSGE